MSKLPAVNLGDLEIAAMECLWRMGEADVKAVHATLGVARGVTPNTIQSTLDRLHRKRLLTRRKVSHAFVYKAAVDRVELVGEAIGAVMRQLAGKETGAALTAFVDFAARTDRKILGELERLVGERLRAEKRR